MEKPIIFVGENDDDMNYPIGIQTFSRITQEDYVYVDKTDLVWNLAHSSPYVFLSRPRRFGKSLLCSTLASYFRGERELFEGKKIMELEKDWDSYPVFHVDLSVAKRQPSADELRRVLLLLLDPLVEKYGKKENEKSPGDVLRGLIRRAYEQTGKQVAVIIDEYDAPLLDVLHESQQLDQFRNVMQEFYVQLKAGEAMVKFCFITGITKFSQLSIFSTINNLRNVSMEPAFAAICGITKEELETVLMPNIEELAEANNWSAEETLQKLKLQYDGYHFSAKSPDIFNPFSLMNAFATGNIGNYWFASGTPSFLFQQMKHFRTDITTLEEMHVQSYDFDQPTEAMNNALPLLYQSGYLTIKDYDKESEMYTLSIPNQEVRIGFTRGLLPAYIGLDNSQVVSGFALKFWQALKKNDLDFALREMQSYFAGLPYVDGFKKKLEDVSNLEGFYEWSMMLIFNMLNVYVQTQVRCAGGRADMVVKMPDTIYVIELKVNGTAQEALDQIEKNGYAAPYLTGGRNVVKAGVKFSTKTKTIEDWIIKN